MRLKQFRFALCALGLSAVLLTAAPSASHKLTIADLMQIKHPSNAVISPDGRSVVFLWDEGGVGNLYSVSLSGSAGSPKKLTSFPSGQINEAFWAKDSKTVYFPHEGSLWQATVPGGAPQAVTGLGGTKGRDFTLSPDGSKVAFVAGGSKGSDLFIQAISGGAETKLAHNDASIAAVTWSPDGKHLLYSGGGKTILHEQTPTYSGAKIIYTITERTPGTLYVVSSSGGASTAIEAPDGGGGAKWIDAGHLVFDRGAKDFKKRTVYVADIQSGKSRIVHEDVDKKFWSMPGGTGDSAQPSPDGKWLCFVSDRNGWDSLYVVPTAGGAPIQLTTGHFEAWRPAWSHDSKSLAFDANSVDHPGDRQLFVVLIGDRPTPNSAKAVTSGKGTNIAAEWAPDDKTLLYQHTDTQNSADLFALNPKEAGKPNRLTDSMPASFDRTAFVEPEFVHFPGADGKLVPGWLFVPKNLDRSKKHPAIVWIHGDGINQNYDGWHVQRNYSVYYSFHQYLLQQGYVVFAPDYRGSIGYGRDWRQGVYMDVGGKDAKDAWMAGRYLKTLPYVDGERMGVWGLSYGGFFTLIAVTDQPRLFRAGVDVAGVVDYRMYYEDPYHGSWTASRIGTPEQNPHVYDNASPISHLDRLERPLLILHGTADINVPYLESVRLVDQSLKLNKGELVQFMMYPGEFHYFDRRPVLQDAWRRVDEFFRKNVMDYKPGGKELAGTN